MTFFDFEVWPGPMEGVGGTETFVRTVNSLKLTERWMTPFYRLSSSMPSDGKLRRFLEPFTETAPLPVAVQLMGTDPELLADAAVKFAAFGAAEININFGCPSKRVISGGAGGGALLNPAQLLNCCTTVRKALPREIPLSVKMRCGFSDPAESERLIPELTASGSVSKIFLHYRTVSEGYSNFPLSQRQKRFARAVELCENKLPIIANGDISSVDEAVCLVNKCGCSGVMITRPWMRDPYLLRRFNGDRTDAEAGREKFFAEAQRQNVPRGTLLELARLLWGINDHHFRSMLDRC